MPRLSRIAFLLIFTALLGLFALPNSLSDFLQPSARAATTFTVNSTGDAPDSNTADGVCDDGGGNCTLRAAIQQANALAGDDIINITATGTIILTSALPDITTNITIVGPDARRTNVSGAGAFRVFNVNGNVFVTISGLTISGGRAGFGAGVNNTSATTSLNNCVITNNTATGFGGGVNNNGGGHLSVFGTTIAYNSADSAGGLYNSGLVTLADTTVSSNIAANNGGGLENVGNDFTLLSVTVYGNRAQVFGGGIHNPGIGVMSFNNTVVAGNYAGNTGPDINGARVVSGDYNLVENTSGVDISGTTTHNLTGIAPALGPLQDNGGPTPTHAPLPGSALIDQGSASLISSLTTDQRGFARVSDSPSVANAAGGDGSDIGAFEVAASEFLVVNSLADTSDGNCDAQNCTLREAINAANSAADHNTIRFNVSGTINLTGALPEIATDLAIEGPGAKSLIVKRNTVSGYRIFKIASGVTARISGLTATGGNPDEADSLGGGAVYNAGTLTLSEVAITDNHAVGGGGIHNIIDGTLYLVGSTLSGNNTGFGGGGGIFNSGTLYVQTSTITGNSGGNNNGGGIFNFGGTANLKITNSTITTNNNRGIFTISSPDLPVILAGTIVANNDGDSSAVDVGAAGGGVIVSNGYNLIRTPASTVITPGQNPGTDIFNQNPQLGPLQDNGGPTQTQALPESSPAIDKGKNFAADSFVNPAPRDQRGVLRPFDFTSIAPAAGGDNSDIGAFELRPVAETPSSKWVNEDSSLSFGFFVGDQTVTSISATSSDQTLVPDSNININGSGPERTIQITPAANRSGSATITVSLNGSNEGAVTRTFSLTVNSVNDAPTFTKGGDQTVLEDAGPQTVSNWATGINAGPNESSQTLSFVVTGNTNPSLFSAAPSISANGTLTYTPAPDANGSAAITFVLKDDGGTLNGGQDTSAPQTFTINVTAVNDAPVANPQTVNTDEDTPKAITLTGSDVEGTALTFRVVFAPAHGMLTGTGASRTYTPEADFNGVDSFTFKATDTGGEESAEATVTINVAAVNDAPVNSVPVAQQTLRDTPLVFSAANSNAVSVSDVDAGGGSLRVTLTAAHGTLTLGGTSGLTFVTGDGTDDASMTFTGTVPNVNAALANLTFKPSAGFDGAASLQITTDDQGSTGSGGAKSDTDTVAINVALDTVEFAQATYTVAEMGGSLAVTVRRQGDTSQASSVDYSTDDGSTPGVVVTCAAVTGLALDRCDYTKALGTLHFAAGETEKTIVILISDDAYTEGTETAHVKLSNAGGSSILGAQTSATFEITDDSPESPANPIDGSEFFVRQHYHDFLNREPDASGLAFWIGQMTNCGNPNLEVCRVNVSAAFFKSIEFQETGYLVERTYKAAFGDTTSPGVAGTVPIIRLEEFLADTQRIGQDLIVGQGDWQAKLEANKVAYFQEFVTRERLTNAVPTSMTPAQFVDALFQNAGVTPTAAERQAAIDEFGGASNTTDTAARGRALRRIAENPTLNQLEKNRAFVLMEYFGYLRRNPDDAPQPGLNYSGWKFWLGKLEEFNGDFVRAEMVKAFLSSDEYRHRFGQ